LKSSKGVLGHTNHLAPLVKAHRMFRGSILNLKWIRGGGEKERIGEKTKTDNQKLPQKLEQQPFEGQESFRNTRLLKKGSKKKLSCNNEAGYRGVSSPQKDLLRKTKKRGAGCGVRRRKSIKIQLLGRGGKEKPSRFREGR